MEELSYYENELREEYFENKIEEFKDMVDYKEKQEYEIFKRILDIIFSLIAIIPSTIIIIIFSIIIILESEGNPIFTQVRVGKYGELIKIHKLRSMRKDAEANGQKWAEKNDPRITKIGKFIRKYRIDELPQVYDILFGKMSLIGPRPEIPTLTNKFNDETPGFVNRLLVTPGLTGLAQVNGGYDLNHNEKLKYDIEYIENRNIKMYFEIIFKTIKIVLTGDGAR